LYDTFDLSMAGGRAEVGYSLRARAITDSARALDAGISGVRLSGTLFTRTGNGTMTCELAEPFTADRL
jgi:hypothetical protein